MAPGSTAVLVAKSPQQQDGPGGGGPFGVLAGLFVEVRAQA